VDAIFHSGLPVNTLLGIVYAMAAISVMRLVHHLMNCNIEEYALVASKKGLIISFFFLIAVTCATVSYQNLFNDFSSTLLWWRLGIITSIAYITLRLGTFAGSLRRALK